MLVNISMQRHLYIRLEVVRPKPLPDTPIVLHLIYIDIHIYDKVLGYMVLLVLACYMVCLVYVCSVVTIPITSGILY